MEELESAMQDPKTTGEVLRQALIEARLAGAPMELIDRAFGQLDRSFPAPRRLSNASKTPLKGLKKALKKCLEELSSYTKTELELLVAKQVLDLDHI